MAITNKNRIIRKMIVAFGNIFNNITLVRYNQDNSEQERFLVPITYAPKELYVQRLEADPDLDKKTQVTLPRISYEMLGMDYDASRKLNTNVRNFSYTSGAVNSFYNPVPYDFHFAVSIYTRTHEDAHSVVECVLPFFTPDYTINVTLIPESGITKQIPIILNSIDRDVQYSGNRDSDTRMIIWSLDFTLKGWIYGSNEDKSNNLIKHTITNFDNFDIDAEYARIDIVVDPYTANVSSNWTANTTITEY